MVLNDFMIIIISLCLVVWIELYADEKDQREDGRDKKNAKSVYGEC